VMDRSLLAGIAFALVGLAIALMWALQGATW
jgi:hypothetical protein